MKKSKKGFVVSAILYPLLVLFLAIIMGLLSMTDTRKRILDKMKLEITDNIFDDAACSCDTILAKLNYIIANGVGGSGGDTGSYAYNKLTLNVKTYEAYSDFPVVGNIIGDIAVLSTTPIKNYYVSTSVPKSPQEGTVWIVQDNTSNYYVTSDWNKIGISYVMQYESGKWVLKKSYVYNGESWTMLYYVPLKNGYVDLTGSDINAPIINTYDYTGEYQTFKATFAGIYKVELWGAQGGSYGSNLGGKGGYTSGKIYLDAGETIYIYVGGQGKNGSTSNYSEGGWNGGGTSGTTSSNYSGGGGGATDIRLKYTSSKDVWNEFESLKSRIMVAAGGGGVGYFSGASSFSYGGAGGGLFGKYGGLSYGGTNSGYKGLAGGGQQAMPGSGYKTTDGENGTPGDFGVGGTSPSSYGGGGGGGYYGGGSGNYSNSLVGGGGGGSSYISGMAGSNSISEESTSTNIIHTGNQYHYSNKFFYDTVMIDGEGKKFDEYIQTSANQPTKKGDSTQIGNSGNGYAKIELLIIGVDIGPDKNEYVNSYSFQNKAQEFIAPVNGTYKFELWGASGASKGYTTGGKGAYTSGNIYLTKGEKFYVYVGSWGEVYGDIAFNGGGKGSSNYSTGSGGGATDIRLVSGLWSSFESLKSRIMVAAGGGGVGYWNGATSGDSGGAAGGLNGYSGSINYASNNNSYLSVARGGTQTLGGYGYRYNASGSNGNNGSFGIGANGNTTYGGGGGGGYYGGGGGAESNAITGQGGGGSSYISGHSGCNSILEESTATNIIHNGSVYHYSGYFFENTQMIDGNGYEWKSDLKSTQTNMPSVNSTGLIVGNTGNGYARISLITTEKNTIGVANNKSYSYNFSNSYQVFDVTTTGNYKIELWGASGGNYSGSGGGLGGYTSGDIKLTKGTRLYIFVGQSGFAETTTTFNGGGDGIIERSNGSTTRASLSGGGATDIRTEASSSIKVWDSQSSLRTRIMVAAGGGGASWWSSGTSYSNDANAGGLTGYNGGFTYTSNNSGYTSTAQGGSQIAGGTGWIYNRSGQNGLDGSFGLGAGSSELAHGGGGGGGYYGGGSGGHSNAIVGQGAGGSSYISGHEGCIAIDSNGNPKTISYSTISDSISYTGYQFTNTQMIDGKGYNWTTEKGTTANLMPERDGSATMKGNVGHGYALITYLGA